MILGTTIQDRLEKVCETPSTFRFDFDIRYLAKWIRLHPSVFPKYVLEGNYNLNFNWVKLRWEILKNI